MVVGVVVNRDGAVGTDVLGNVRDFYAAAWVQSLLFGEFELIFRGEIFRVCCQVVYYVGSVLCFTGSVVMAFVVGGVNGSTAKARITYGGCSRVTVRGLVWALVFT